jgi:drug/metabolite transporter (DMT)-like permease
VMEPRPITFPRMSSTVHTLTPGRGVAVTRPGVSITDLLLLLMAFIWGVNIAVVKYGTMHLTPLAYNGVRVSLAALTLVAIGASLRIRWPSRRDVLTLLLLGMLGNGLYQLLFIEGVAHTRAGNAALVLAATPAFVALVGWLRGVERIRRRAMIGIGISIVGIALVVIGTAPVAAGVSTLLGDLLVLGGCLCWAVFTVLLNPYAKRVNAIHVSAITMTGGAIPLLFVAAPSIAATDWSAVPAKVWGAIVFSGLGALVIAYLCWYRGVKILGPTRTSMYGNLQPIVALLFAWILLHEVPTVMQGVGAASIITGLLMTRA